MLMASKRHIWMFMAVRRDSLWSRPTGRIADAHESSGGVHGALTALGIDIAELNEGHGRALDRVFDAVITALAVVEEQIDHLRGRQA